MNIEEGNPAEAIRACGRHLGFLHLAENYRAATSVPVASISAASSTH